MLSELNTIKANRAEIEERMLQDMEQIEKLQAQMQEIEGQVTTGTVEAVVPGAGNLYRINVIVDNAAGLYLPGSAATLALPQQHDRLAISVPLAAIQQNGDLTGVYVRSGETTVLRWVQLGARTGDGVEVLTGLRDGEQIVLPAAAPRGAE